VRTLTEFECLEVACVTMAKFKWYVSTIYSVMDGDIFRSMQVSFSDVGD